MSTPRLDPTALKSMLDAGTSQAEAARYFGVSASAISQRVKAFRRERPHPAPETYGTGATIINGEISAPDRLAFVQRAVDRELEWALDEARQPEADRKGLQRTILTLAGEVRQQLALQLSISKAVVDIELVREFRQTVTEAIAEESPETARRIVARLKAHRAQRRVVGLAALDGRGGVDHVA